MNVIGKLTLFSTLLGLVACKAESRLDLTSLTMSQNNQAPAVYGYAITEQNNLLSVPEEFAHIHTLSMQLLDKDWQQHPNFLGELTELKSLFSDTKLPEAAYFIETLEATKQRYLSYLNNIDSVAKAMQHEIDESLDCYNDSIEKLNERIRLIETPEDTYIAEIHDLKSKVEDQSRQYSQLNATFHQSLQQVIDKQNPEIKLIDDLTFSYDNLPHSICPQYKDMSELLTTIPNNCVYINRDQLLSPFPSNLRTEASDLINRYAPKIWRSMTQLNGYFDTSKNKQYFPDNVNYQLAQARKALREKRFLDEQDSAALVDNYQQKLTALQLKRDNTFDKGFLNQHQRVDTSSEAFINKHFNEASPPSQPFSDVYSSSDIKQRFTEAYARKVLREYPAELQFTVSSEGLFSIPNQQEASRLIFNFDDTYQYVTYDIIKRSQLPHIIRADSDHIAMSTQSLIDDLNSRLQRYWRV